MAEDVSAEKWNGRVNDCRNSLMIIKY
jgi:hypothetical protein